MCLKQNKGEFVTEYSFSENIIWKMTKNRQIKQNITRFSMDYKIYKEQI
jgi:hypothetical protein